MNNDLQALIVTLIGFSLFLFFSYGGFLLWGIISLGACFIASYFIMSGEEKEDRLKKMEARIKELEDAQKSAQKNDR